jgi:hypothetical protein
VAAAVAASEDSAADGAEAAAPAEDGEIGSGFRVPGAGFPVRFKVPGSVQGSRFGSRFPVRFEFEFRNLRFEFEFRNLRLPGPQMLEPPEPGTLNRTRNENRTLNPARGTRNLTDEEIRL